MQQQITGATCRLDMTNIYATTTTTTLLIEPQALLLIPTTSMVSAYIPLHIYYIMKNTKYTYKIIKMNTHVQI